MCQGDMGDGGRDMLAIVEQGDNARVQRLQRAPVMLQKEIVSLGIVQLWGILFLSPQLVLGNLFHFSRYSPPAMGSVIN